MKIPGIGEVKNSYVAVGGSTVVLVVGYAYYKNSKAKAANAAALASAATASSQDTGSTGSPDYGTNYGGQYYAGYGGTDPNTGTPYAYENYFDHGSSNSGSSITTNQMWISQAEQDAQSYFGATRDLAVSAVSKYMSQTASGLNPDEYRIMQDIVGELGQPPTGGPYRFIQASGTIQGGNPPGGGTGGATYKTLTPGMVITVPVNTASHGGMQGTAQYFDISLGKLLHDNPGKTSTYQGQVNILYLVHPGETLDSIAKRFGISPEHLAQDLASEGVI